MASVSAKAPNQGDLTQGTPWKKILYFTIPLLIGNVFQQLYNVVDTIIVGHYVGESALAAVGLAFPILFFLISMFMGLGVGATVLIAQFFGAKDFEHLKRVTTTTYIFLFWGAIAMTIIGLLTCSGVLKLMNTPTDVFDQAKAYLNISYLGTIGVFGYNSICAILRGIGDSKSPLYFLIVATIVNIILDLLFVAVFRWGVAGAAWATIIAQFVSFIISALYLNRHYPLIRINFKELIFDKKLFKEIVRIGIPAAIQQMLVSLGLIAVQRLVNSYGTNTMAGFTAASRIDSFAMMPIMNIGSAISTFTGQNIGAGKIDRIKKGTVSGNIMTIIYCALALVIILLFGRILLRIFNDNPEVVNAGLSYLHIVSPFYCTVGIMFVFTSVMRGAGDAIRPLIVSLGAMWFFRVPIAYLLSGLFHTPDGIWWAFPIGWTIGLLMSLIFYYRGKWKQHAIVFTIPSNQEQTA